MDTFKGKIKISFGAQHEPATIKIGDDYLEDLLHFFHGQYVKITIEEIAAPKSEYQETSYAHGSNYEQREAK